MARDPYQDPDDEARAMLRALVHEATFAALAFEDPETHGPGVSRIAFAVAPDGVPMSLISDLSAHSAALKANPACAVLIGEPGDRGDPLTHPRLSLTATASFARHGDPEHGALGRAYLQQRPKAKLYIGFGDFAIVRFTPVKALLNGGFGKAVKFDVDALGQILAGVS